MQAEDTTITDIKLDDMNKDTKTSFNNLALNISAIEELKLMVDPKNETDLQQIKKILKQILDYPELEITQMHIKAMKLGNFDIQNQTQSTAKRMDTSASMVNQQPQSQFCPCCGFKIQQDSIQMCRSFSDIKNMGLSTYLYFSIFKNLAILLIILLIIYSGYALATNVLASNSLGDSGIIDYSKIDYINISLSSKQTNDTPTNRLYYYISCWLGVATAIIWLLVIICIKYGEIKDSNEYDKDTISSSDYSIVMQGLPLNVNLQELQKQFDQYFQTTIKNNSRFPAIWRQPLKIAKMNIGKPFYLHEDEFKGQDIEQINNEITEMKEKFAEWIIQRQQSREFKTTRTQRERLYQRYAQLIENRNNKCIQLSDKITSVLKKETGERQDLTNVFITFEINNNKTILNFIHDSGILSKIRALCNTEHQRFTYKQDGKEYGVHLARAPEPEDIIWTNIGQNKCVSYRKKIITFSITTILLGISFAIVYGLTKLQQAKNDDRMVSIAISCTIGIINAIIGQAIRKLTLYQKDYTQTQRQASLSLKSILAQMVNSILIPVITAYYIKGNLYEVSGLVDNIFMLSITTSILPPLLVLLDPYHIFMKIMRCIKSKPTSKLYQTQKEHNLLHQGIEFQVGYNYIYPANVFVFVCYFVSLQPIVAFIGLFGYLLMYWVQKYCLFKRYRRPVPGTDFVNNAVYRIILMGPFIFSLGSLTWSNFTPGGIPPEALLPNLIILGISVIIFAIPYNTVILGSCFQNNYEANKKYDDERIIFPSQYDRLNPSTQQEGMEEYKKYLERKVKEIQQMSQEKRAQFQQKYLINAQRGQAVQRAQFNMPYMQNFRYIQPMPVYQQFPQLGYAPLNPGFGFTNYRVVPGLPITPPVPYQPYMQPRPMAPPPPVYPSVPMMIPPPPAYNAQPLYRAQGNQSNQGRPIVYLQSNIQPQRPVNYNNSQVHNSNNIPRNTFHNPQPQVIQMSNQMNMNYNINIPNMNVNPAFINRGNNRGW